MKDFKDKVAVITGGASGLGLAMARRCAAEGMKLVLADIEEEALRKVETEFRKAGTPVIGIRTDVSRGQDMERLAEKTLATFGGVHLLCNNAGVGPGGVVWENTVADWEWVLGVNVWGVIHGVRVFLPIMLRQDADCHVVNTASVAGLLSVPEHGHLLRVQACGGHADGVPVPRPRAAQLARRRVAALSGLRADRHHRLGAQPPRPAAQRPARQDRRGAGARRAMRKAVLSGKVSAEQVAEMVFDAVQTNRFYILTHPKIKGAIQTRMEDILQERSPTDTSRPPKV